MAEMVDAFVHFTPIRLCRVLGDLQDAVLDLRFLMRPLCQALVVDLASEEGNLFLGVLGHIIMFSAIDW